MGNEVYPASSHSNWPLDTLPEEELGQLTPFQQIQTTPIWVCMNWLFSLSLSPISDATDLHNLFDCIQEGFMIEDLLSDVLNFRDEPEALEGSQSVGTCMIDSKKTINHYTNIFSYGCQQGILIYISLKMD